MMKPSEIWQQILSTPGDKKLKADFLIALEEVGDPRAEMFRLADELHALIHGYFEREAALKAKYLPLERQWSAEFEPNLNHWEAQLRFVRGWPTELTLEASQFVKHAAEIVAFLPVRHLNLKKVREAPSVFSSPFLAQIASIDAHDQRFSKEALLALTSSPNLGSLRWLNLSDTEIDDSGIEMLAASPRLRQLEHLDLTKNPGRDPVDASCGYGTDGITNYIVTESIWLPAFGRELEEKFGRIEWLHALGNYMEKHPPNRHQF